MTKIDYTRPQALRTKPGVLGVGLWLKVRITGTEFFWPNKWKFWKVICINCGSRLSFGREFGYTNCPSCDAYTDYMCNPTNYIDYR